MDEWAIADTVNAEDINPQEVIRYTDDDGQDAAGEVVKVEEGPDGNSVIITLDADLDMERHEVTYQWDDRVDVLYRDYSGVEV